MESVIVTIVHDDTGHTTMTLANGQRWVFDSDSPMGIDDEGKSHIFPCVVVTCGHCEARFQKRYSQIHDEVCPREK